MPILTMMEGSDEKDNSIDCPIGVRGTAFNGSNPLVDGQKFVFTFATAPNDAVVISLGGTVNYKTSLTVAEDAYDRTDVSNIVGKIITAPSAVAASATRLDNGGVDVTVNTAATTADKLIVKYTVNGVAKSEDVTCKGGTAQTIAPADLAFGDAVTTLNDSLNKGVQIVITSIEFQKHSTIDLMNDSGENLANIVSAVTINTTDPATAITKDGTALDLVAGKEYTLKVTAGNSVGTSDVKVVLKYDTTKTVELGTIPANTAANTELTFTFTAPYDLAAAATIEKAS